jgi:hydroxymethylpyrimidine pyrophosphatase-like HAD family hydrolase
MIAIDMDGTLLGEDGQISPRNLAALRTAEARGIEIAIATGRRHSFAMRPLRPLNLHPESALISSNGTVTRTLGACCDYEHSPSRSIACTHLTHETSLWLCNHIEEFRNALVLTFDRTQPDGEDAPGALVVEHLDELNASIGRWMTANEPNIVYINPIEDALTDASDAPIQAMLCGTIERMARAEARLLENPGVTLSGHSPGSAPQRLTLHRTEYPRRNLSILDILPAGCSKGAALLELAVTRKIAQSEILAIGDNWNDISMLEVAGSAVLMANAPDDLKSLARAQGWRIGLANTADGVAEAIESALNELPSSSS